MGMSNGTLMTTVMIPPNSIDLSNNNITSIPPNFFNNQSDLLQVDLSNNQISYLNGSIFAPLVDLEVLNLKNNLITTIAVDVFSDLANLRSLDLAENSITSLPDNLFLHNFNLTDLHLGFNNISAIGRDTFTGLSALQKLFLNNGALSSIHPASFSPLVNAEELYLQDNHIDYLPRNVFRGLTKLRLVNLQGNPLGPQDVLAVLLLLLYGYRANLQVWFIARYPCCRSGRVEDKQYDAYISYSSEDQSLVVREIAPGLEERGFKLCLEYRDFPVGACIASTIIESVEDSRRTILLLSQSFVDCEWCALAFKAAHQQMLKDKQKRIVVIALDGPKLENVDKDLQFFLSTAECLKWGESQFWDKLSYALSGVGRGAVQNQPSDIELKSG
ncbi:PREDICTED: toll-like receptor Tollo [Branchiostoma belcheri]|uniref:Toll-like receptor Tollo n=1 Tax=Branchiostoma belcheri TaxID=7741 RepID=A0A6P4ZQL0_BRABE|nr:PREDICTED: toll-like receptor Tollo [Branchiostoma belcheri]